MNVKVDLASLMPDVSLEWNSVHPSEITCARKIFFHLTSPELGIADKNLLPLAEVGAALHKHLLPAVAAVFEKAGYKTQQEVEGEMEIAGLTVKGRADLIAENEYNHRIVVELKFVHPNAIHKIPLHYLRQIAIYTEMFSAHWAYLLMFARDLLDVRQYVFSKYDLANHYQNAVEIISSVKKAIDENDVSSLPVLPAYEFPCRWATLRGVALCPFYHLCHSEIADIPTNDTDWTAKRLHEIATEYLKVRLAYEVKKGELVPLESRIQELEAFLKENTQHGDLIKTPIGSVRTLEITQKVVDIDAVRELLQDQTPYKQRAYKRLDVQYVGGVRSDALETT